MKWKIVLGVIALALLTTSIAHASRPQVLAPYKILRLIETPNAIDISLYLPSDSDPQDDMRMMRGLVDYLRPVGKGIFLSICMETPPTVPNPFPEALACTHPYYFPVQEEVVPQQEKMKYG